VSAPQILSPNKMPAPEFDSRTSKKKHFSLLRFTSSITCAKSLAPIPTTRPNPPQDSVSLIRHSSNFKSANIPLSHPPSQQFHPIRDPRFSHRAAPAHLDSAPQTGKRLQQQFSNHEIISRQRHLILLSYPASMTHSAAHSARQQRIRSSAPREIERQPPIQEPNPPETFSPRAPAKIDDAAPR
jgi:hypothetical protein